MVRRSLVVLLLAVACVASTAGGATAMVIGGEVFGAFNTHSMSQWNDDLVAPINQSGGNMDEFGSAFTGGLGLRMWPSSNWMLAATWEPLFNTKQESVSNVEVNLDANAFEATAGYFFPSTSQAKFGLGGGLGYYSLAGETTGFTALGAPELDGKLTGSTVGFHFLGLMEWTASPGFAVTGSAGYRIAKISDTQLDDLSSDPETETDYSGLMLRAGLAFYMPSAK